jgi:hypothetical protein
MAYREEVEKLYRGGLDTVGKQHFTLLYDRARQKARSRRNILSGWSKAGLKPLNPHKVLNEIHKPILKDSSSVIVINKKIHDVYTLKPPDTPITSDALSALRQSINVVLEKAQSLEPVAKLCIRKLANAAENAFAERSILLDENLLLFQQNNEKAVRVSTKATMVGNAKVMKYEDIMKKQEAHDEKEFKPKATQGHPRVNHEQSKPEPKRRRKISE